MPGGWKEQNYSRSIGVKEAARQAGVSRACLYLWAFQAGSAAQPAPTRFIRSTASSGPPSCCAWHAAISAVAASVGLEDPLYFSRAFRRAVGQSPRNTGSKTAPQRLKTTADGAIL